MQQNYIYATKILCMQGFSLNLNLVCTLNPISRGVDSITQSVFCNNSKTINRIGLIFSDF